jgi:hypothetical protein
MLFSDYIYPSGKEGRRKEWNKGGRTRKNVVSDRGSRKLTIRVASSHRKMRQG